MPARLRPLLRPDSRPGNPLRYAANPVLLLTELHYLPPAAWFVAALAAPGGVLLERHEHYQKQTFRNRALVLTAQGPKALTVPVRGGGSQVKQRIDEIRIDYSHNWMLPHWRTLQSAYNRTPYFLYYADALHALLVSRPATLYELNQGLLELVCSWLAPRLPVAYTEAWYPHYDPARVLDRRNFFHPDAPPDRMRVPAYQQAFGNTFANGLSVLDALFALGPGTAAWLRAAAPSWPGPVASPDSLLAATGPGG